MRLHTDNILAVSVEGRQVNAMIEDLERQRDRLRSQFAELGDLRPGSLVARYRKCGSPGCHCAQKGDPGHGPSWSLIRAVKGKMGKPAEQRSGHRFRILRCGERLASNSRQGTTRSSSRARAGFPPLAAGLEVIAEVHLAPRLSRGSRQPADPSIIAVAAPDSSLRSWSPSQPIRP